MTLGNCRPFVVRTASRSVSCKADFGGFSAVLTLLLGMLLDFHVQWGLHVECFLSSHPLVLEACLSRKFWSFMLNQFFFLIGSILVVARALAPSLPMILLPLGFPCGY
jgi:hypothetical protein